MYIYKTHNVAHERERKRHERQKMERREKRQRNASGTLER